MRVRPLYAAFLVIQTLACLWGGSTSAFLRERPDSEAASLVMLFSEESFEVLRVEKGWVEVGKGEFEGWMSVKGLWNLIEEKTAPLALVSRVSESDFDGR